MSSKDFILDLMTKSRVTPKKLATRTGINNKSLTKFLDGKGKLSTDEYMKLGEYFNLSLDTLVKGTYNDYDNDAHVVKGMKPKEEDLLEEFIDKCNNIIDKAGLSEYREKLLPTVTYRTIRDNTFIDMFNGGIFHTDTRFRLDYTYYPLINLKEVLRLDNSKIYIALKDHPRTYGQLRYIMKLNGDTKGLNESKLKDYNSGDWYNEREVPSLKFDDIISLTDVELYKEVDLENDLRTCLYRVSPDNVNYWKIMEIFLNKGAYLVLSENAMFFGIKSEIDHPATEMFKHIVKQKV